MGMRIAAALAFTVLATAAVIAYASRNSAGTMAPANGPYVAGTVISSSVVNARFSDIETEITDSLSRSGKGGMISAIRGIDGTVAAPAHSYTSEVGSGLYRIGASDHGFAVAGVKTHEWTATGETVTGTLAVSGGTTLTGNVGIGGASVGNPLDVTIAGTASTSVGNWFESGLADGNVVNLWVGKSAAASSSAILTYTKNATVANSTSCLGLSGSASTLCVDGNGKTTSGSLQIGSSGTAISGSFRGTATFNPGTVGANTCGSVSVTVTGAVQGSECLVGLPGGAGTLQVACEITAANTCSVNWCNTTAVGITPVTGNVACRAFNP